MPIAAPGAPRVFKTGDVFRDHYVVEDFLGEGGSGQVYGVRNDHTLRRCALKVMHLADLGDAKKGERALVQARAMYTLRHRNVVEVLDLAVEKDGMVWLLMERLDGWTLAELIDRHGPLSPIAAIDVALEIAWGLQVAHDNFIIHRDIKPSNVFVTTGGAIKILDFSLAKVTLIDPSSAGQAAKGTVGYMAPEQLMSAPASPQQDIFALGTTLYEMLVGRLPFEAPRGAGSSHLDRVMTLDQTRRQLLEEPESLVTAANLPSYVDDVVRTAMAKDSGEAVRLRVDPGAGARRRAGEARAGSVDGAARQAPAGLGAQPPHRLGPGGLEPVSPAEIAAEGVACAGPPLQARRPLAG